MENMRRVDERRFEKIKLLNQGYREHELVKDSHHNWRPRVVRKAISSEAAIQKHRIKNNVLCRLRGHDRPTVKGPRGRTIKAPICIRCGKNFQKGWAR